MASGLAAAIFVLPIDDIQVSLQRVGIPCYASAVYATAVPAVRPSVSPSVRPYVTRWYCVETNEATIMRSRPVFLSVARRARVADKTDRGHTQERVKTTGI